MSYFIFRGYDNPELSADVRASVRPSHRAYIREMHHGVRAVAGGAALTDEGGKMTGTMLVLSAPDRAAVMRFLEGDPYWNAHLFARYEVDRWDWGLGAPIPSQE